MLHAIVKLVTKSCASVTHFVCEDLGDIKEITLIDLYSGKLKTYESINDIPVGYEVIGMYKNDDAYILTVSAMSACSLYMLLSLEKVITYNKIDTQIAYKIPYECLEVGVGKCFDAYNYSEYNLVSIWDKIYKEFIGVDFNEFALIIYDDRIMYQVKFTVPDMNKFKSTLNKMSLLVGDN